VRFLERTTMPPAFVGIRAIRVRPVASCVAVAIWERCCFVESILPDRHEDVNKKNRVANEKIAVLATPAGIPVSPVS
jgi:hypothetical protein